MAAAPELKQLGRYDLTRVLGKGAMGIVYEGMDPKLHRKVAIKTILKGHLDDEEAAKEYSMRFMREAQAVARLNHPNIVQVYDFGEEGDVAYIVMEFIKGKELKNFFDANERFELKEGVRIMCELLDALDFAHEAGIIHRDIKPANLLLECQTPSPLRGEPGRGSNDASHLKLWITDFGLARIEQDAGMTMTGDLLGTLRYMSPEQALAKRVVVDHRSDLYSLGVTLYELLTLQPAYAGDDRQHP